VGLGALLARTREVTDEMFAAAALALAQSVTDEDIGEGNLFPRVRELRRVAARVAAAVIREAARAGLGRPLPDATIDDLVSNSMWDPSYVPYDPLPAD
jgi:malate dehydrogenase (oxaloacetate-decarboxylating)